MTETATANAYQADPTDYLTRITRLFGGYKRRALEFLELKPGQRLLDVGCGTGDDLLAIAGAMKGSLGLTGVDLNGDTLETARKRAAEAGADIDFIQGDLSAIPLEDGAVDVVRSDRVLQHVEDPVAALREMARVCRPGGHIAAVDVDWGTLVVDHPHTEVTDKLCVFTRDHHVNGRSGRCLRRWLTEAGLEDVTGYADAVCVTDLDIAVFVWVLQDTLDRMAKAGHITPREAEDWMSEARRLDAAGLFCGSMTGFVMRGTVPVID